MRFKKDPDTLLYQAIPLSGDTSTLNNGLLSREASEHEIYKL